MSQMPLQQSAFINGLNLTFYEWGDASNPSLICLHSHTNSAASWKEFAEYASSDYHVYAIDQRGHGNSEWASDGYAREKFVQDLSEFIEQKKLADVSLVGCSMGGWHSILYTHLNPKMVNKIVMVDIAPEPSQERLNAPPSPPTPMYFNEVDDVFNWLRSGNPFASDARLLEETKSRIKQTESGQWTWKADLEGFDNPLPDMTSESLIKGYWNAIKSIECPIYEIRGAESGLVSDEVLTKMEKIGKDVSSTDVERAGHVVMVDQPEAFIEAIKSFL